MTLKKATSKNRLRCVCPMTKLLLLGSCSPEMLLYTHACKETGARVLLRRCLQQQKLNLEKCSFPQSCPTVQNKVCPFTRHNIKSSKQRRAGHLHMINDTATRRDCGQSSECEHRNKNEGPGTKASFRKLGERGELVRGGTVQNR